jgi:hypothetical protein
MDISINQVGSFLVRLAPAHLGSHFGFYLVDVHLKVFASEPVNFKLVLQSRILFILTQACQLLIVVSKPSYLPPLNCDHVIWLSLLIQGNAIFLLARCFLQRDFIRGRHWLQWVVLRPVHLS